MYLFVALSAITGNVICYRMNVSRAGVNPAQLGVIGPVMQEHEFATECLESYRLLMPCGFEKLWYFKPESRGSEELLN